MKRKLMIAALALLMTSGAAHAFTQEQNHAVEAVAIANFAGNANHCPGVQLIDETMRAELEAAGVTLEMLRDMGFAGEVRGNNLGFALNIIVEYIDDHQHSATRLGEALVRTAATGGRCWKRNKAHTKLALYKKRRSLMSGFFMPAGGLNSWLDVASLADPDPPWGFTDGLSKLECLDRRENSPS